MFPPKREDKMTGKAPMDKMPMEMAETDMSWLDSFCEKLSPEECSYLRSKLDDSVPTEPGEMEDEGPEIEIEIEPKKSSLGGGYGDREDSEEL
jgi:hypothetical protein